MKARFPVALPFALLASLAACSSSSSSGVVEPDSGSHKDTGAPHADAGPGDTGAKETGPGKEAGKPDVEIVPDASVDAGSVTPAPGSKTIALGLVQVLGITDDDYVIYFDTKGGISASDIAGNVTQIAAGAPDGGISPEFLGLGGNIVGVLTDYTSQNVMGSSTPIEGTLSIWSHTKTGGVLKQVATHSTGLINISTDSSFVVFTDASDAHGKTGNLGVVAGDGTGEVDFVKGVAIDTSATTCEPFAEFDGKYVVASTCAITDGGTEGTPAISAYDSSASYAATLLTALGGPNAPFSPTDNSINFTTDTAGDNVLTVTPVAGGTLSIQPITGGTATVLSTTFGPLTGGVESFSLSPDSSFALFTETDGSYNRSVFIPPATTPVTTKIAPAGSIAGVFYTSADLNYETDYATPIASGGIGPASLNLRNTTTGVAFPLIPANTGLATSLPGGFTADSKYAIFSTDLKMVGGAGASTGTLKVAAVTDGTIATIDSSTNVWDGVALTGSKIIYNTNYVLAVPALTSTSAFADYYVADASSPSQGTLVVKGADAPNDFYLTKDKSHMFYSFTHLVTVDGGEALEAGDGLYSVALP